MSNALLIIDMQRRWINDLKLIYPSTSSVIKNIQSLRNHFKAQGFPIFHLAIEYHSDGSNMRAGETLFNTTGSTEAEIIQELRPHSTEFVVKKTRLSGFFNTDLLEQLKKNNVQGVAITGLELRSCVMATYLDAYQYDFRPTAIISDAVLDHNKAYIENFMREFQGQDFLMPTEEWIRSR